jgi:hypothetical protein
MPHHFFFVYGIDVILPIEFEILYLCIAINERLDES